MNPHKTIFRNYIKADVTPLIISINMMGENLTGLELGVFKAESFMTILHNCPNVKKLIGVDHWKPFVDYIQPNPDGNPTAAFGEFEVDLHKNISLTHIKHGTPDDKEVKFIIKDSMEAVKDIEDESLDFIFFDAMLTAEQTLEEGMAYYPKIKKGGYFTGHDSQCIEQVIKPINEVRKNFNNNNKLISYANCFIFKK